MPQQVAFIVRTLCSHRRKEYKLFTREPLMPPKVRPATADILEGRYLVAWIRRGAVDLNQADRKYVVTFDWARVSERMGHYRVRLTDPDIGFRAFGVLFMISMRM